MWFIPTLMLAKPLHSCSTISKIPKSFVSSSQSLHSFQHLESAKLPNPRDYPIARWSRSQMLKKMVVLPAEPSPSLCDLSAETCWSAPPQGASCEPIRGPGLANIHGKLADIKGYHRRHQGQAGDRRRWPVYHALLACQSALDICFHDNAHAEQFKKKIPFSCLTAIHT